MERWESWLHGLAGVLGPLLSAVPPKLGSLKPADLKDEARLAWQLRRLGVSGVRDITRLFTMSGSTPHASMHASDCTANASLSSIALTSRHTIPARRSAISAASTGA